ncbi:unnamed protein product [Nippostrongylus brasiliensis]|uniref:SDR family NAD(P)-dependent oxidoreductase n=1 Tax=Nippostrongylus brasiliensis TaxID=27835 RepID=A0A0N4YRZ6_NIPBR|nr:unnamed protein product [Nippostrongylus brasiliensis]
MPRFQDKVVIITGSSSGIGATTALLFAKEGARITITGRKQDKLKVNNAGGFLGMAGFDASDEDFAYIVDVNLKSVMQLTRLARPHLIASKGEIVNISSIVGQDFAVSLFIPSNWTEIGNLVS